MNDLMRRWRDSYTSFHFANRSYNQSGMKLLSTFLVSIVILLTGAISSVMYERCPQTAIKTTGAFILRFFHLDLKQMIP